MAVVMGWTCLYHSRASEKGKRSKLIVRRQGNPSLIIVVAKQTWLSELKTFNYQFGYWEPKKTSLSSLWKGEKRGFPKLTIIPAHLLLTSMSPLPSCHNRLHPVPLARKRQHRDLESQQSGCSLLLLHFHVFFALAETTILMLCLFYVYLSYILTANRYLCFLDWWRPCNLQPFRLHA